MFALLFTPAFALELDVSPADRCERAPIVAVIEVTSREVQWSDGPRVGHRVLKGRLPSDSLELVHSGGELPSGLRQWFEDAPDLEMDRSYLALLAPRGDHHHIVGGQHGLFDLDALPDLGRCL